MTHFYERNIVEIKNEYTTHLIDVLTPLIYEGLQSTYNHALEHNSKFDNLSTTNPTIKNPGIIKLFQACLKDIPTLSANAIDIETKRIKEFSRCSEWFDDLVKAVIKSYIVLLTYNSSGKTCKLVQEKHHEKINVNEFIHKCYVECSVIFFNNPELFWHEHNKETMRICKNTSYKLIRQAISSAIHKMLPIRLILQEYLANDYIIPSKEGGNHPNNGFSLVESISEKKPSLLESEKQEHNEEMEKELKKHIEDIIEKTQEADVIIPIPNVPIVEEMKEENKMQRVEIPNVPIFEQEEQPKVEIPAEVKEEAPKQPMLEEDIDKQIGHYFDDVKV